MRHVTMFRFVAVLFLLMLPSWVLAKRAAPAKVEPVVFEGVRYGAPNDNGRRGYVQAWDIKTEKKLWELTVFTNLINAALEEDVQWVFITKLEIRGGMLIVTSEKEKVYRVDLKKRAVIE